MWKESINGVLRRLTGYQLQRAETIAELNRQLEDSRRHVSRLEVQLTQGPIAATDGPPAHPGETRIARQSQALRTPPTPRTTPSDLILHIGSGKTGTSSIQQFLAKNRVHLVEQGVLYPRTPGPTRHLRLSLSLMSDADLVRQPEWRTQGDSSPTQFRQNFERQLANEIENAALPRVLLSDEALYGCSDEGLVRLRALLEGTFGERRVVVYLRRQDDHLCSRYQTVVQRGNVLRLTERLEQMRFASMYDYHGRLRTWERLIEPTHIVVRPFDRERFFEGSLLHDFLAASGVDVRLDDLEPVGKRNESLDAESVEFLRILNLHRVQSRGAQAGLIDNRRLVARLAQSSTGPTLTLPDDLLDAFMAQWEESNERVAREFLGDSSGRLFEQPRKTRNTTVEQRLDPGRVAHFVALLELPESTIAPLQALAEREAMARP